MYNPIYTIPVVALTAAAFTGFNAAVIILLVVGVIAGAITLVANR